MYVWCNIFWQYQFIQMLLKQYSTLSTFDSVSASNIQDTMTRSVYIVGYCSISSTIISSLSVFTLSVFCAFDTNYIEIQFGDQMYHIVSTYFPVFWCGSAFFYMFNFVRNRSFFIKCGKICTIVNCFHTHTDHNNQDTNTKPQTPISVTTSSPTAEAPSNKTAQTDTPSSVATTKSTPIRIKRNPDVCKSDTNSSMQNTTTCAVSCHPVTEHKLNNHQLTLRSLKSDDTLQYASSPSDLYHKAPPTSLVTMCDHCDDICSSDDMDHYRSSTDTFNGLKIRLPVSRRGSSTNMSITTDSSGYTSNSMRSPEQKTPYILDEKTEFIVPLSIIQDTKTPPVYENNNDVTISIHRNDDNNDRCHTIAKDHRARHRARYSCDSNSPSSNDLVILRDRMIHNRFYTDFIRNAVERHKCKPLQPVSSLSSQSTISVSSDGDGVVRSFDAIQHLMLQMHANSSSDMDHVNKTKSCNLMALRTDLDEDHIMNQMSMETDKSRALTDMMVQCGWTDEDVLCVLQRG
eukprot:102930_1